MWGTLHFPGLQTPHPPHLHVGAVYPPGQSQPATLLHLPLSAPGAALPLPGVLLAFLRRAGAGAEGARLQGHCGIRSVSGGCAAVHSVPGAGAAGGQTPAAGLLPEGGEEHRRSQPLLQRWLSQVRWHFACMCSENCPCTDGSGFRSSLSAHSIQRAAVWVLDQYYCDFPVYNPAVLNLPKSILSKKMSAFKIYDLGEGKIGSLWFKWTHFFFSNHYLSYLICRYLWFISAENGTINTTGQSRTTISAASRRRDNSHNEFYYEEAEMERRVRKRKARWGSGRLAIEECPDE